MSLLNMLTCFKIWTSMFLNCLFISESSPSFWCRYLRDSMSSLNSCIVVFDFNGCSLRCFFSCSRNPNRRM